MKRWLPFYAFILVLLPICLVQAQEITFNKVVPPLGSFNGLTGGITQDKNGLIWIAAHGLYKYDGYCCACTF